MKDPRYERLIDLFQTAASEHHRAFQESDGADPEWPQWYAMFLCERLEALLDAEYTESELASLILQVEEERRLKAPDADWPGYYARFFIQRSTKRSVRPPHPPTPSPTRGEREQNP
jgi:hypothetical protein